MKNLLTSLFTVLALAGTAVFSNPAQAAMSLFNFTGTTDSGSYMNENFSGSFAFDAALVPAVGDGLADLSQFTMNFLGQVYTKASADVSPQAVFLHGEFLGLDYVDADSVNNARPKVSLVAGLSQRSEAYLAYEPVDDQLLSGFGSYTVTAVPEPGSYALFLVGLGAVASVAGRSKRPH